MGWERRPKPQGSFGGLGQGTAAQEEVAGRGLTEGRPSLDMARGYLTTDYTDGGWAPSPAPQTPGSHLSKFTFFGGSAYKVLLCSSGCLQAAVLLQQSARVTGYAITPSIECTLNWTRAQQL